jgi:outer membrane protein
MQLTERVRAAWLRLATAEARRRALARAAASAATRLGATRTGAETGERTTLEVLAAESEYLRIDADQRRASFDLLLADLNLRAAAGALDPDQLDRIDHWLQPATAAR